MFPISRDPPEGGTSRTLYIRHCYIKFPISRDPPEGGTFVLDGTGKTLTTSFQFLGIPPKGEPTFVNFGYFLEDERFQFLGIPPKGEQVVLHCKSVSMGFLFPISRDPPEGGTWCGWGWLNPQLGFPISRDPPEGGTGG